MDCAIVQFAAETAEIAKGVGSRWRLYRRPAKLASGGSIRVREPARDALAGATVPTVYVADPDRLQAAEGGSSLVSKREQARDGHRLDRRCARLDLLVPLLVWRRRRA